MGAEVLGAAFRDWQCDVVSLELERTFWEKPIFGNPLSEKAAAVIEKLRERRVRVYC